MVFNVGIIINFSAFIYMLNFLHKINFRIIKNCELKICKRYERSIGIYLFD